MCEWIHTKGVMKTYEILRKPCASFGWKLCTIFSIKAKIYGL